MNADLKEEKQSLIIEMPPPASEKGFVNTDAPTVNYVIPPSPQANEQSMFCSDKDA